MKKLLSFYFIPLIVLLFASACNKDKPSPDEKPISQIVEMQNERLKSVLTTAMVETFLHGHILDESGNPLSGVIVTTNGMSKITDGDGYFVFSNIMLNKDYAVVHATKMDYFEGIRTFTPSENAMNKIEIILQAKGTPKTINASDGGALNFEGDKVKLNFPVGSIADKDGKVYSGNVKVYVRYINPEIENFGSTMPGNLTGLQTDNELTGMISYGMANVELRDNSNNLLQIAGGKTVTVTMPAILDAPVDMPIWHFNEKYGVWVEIGKATKSGGSYTFEANHFSTWNLDISVEKRISRSVVKITSGGKPLSNQKINIYSANFGSFYKTVFTDNNGAINLLRFPSQIGIRVIDCQNIDAITTLSEDSTITLTISPINRAKNYQLSGTVKSCINVYKNTFFRMEGLINKKIAFSGKTDANGKYTSSAILCDITAGSKTQIIATVFTSENTIKKDTFEITFSGAIINTDIDFCETVETEVGEVTDVEGNTYSTIVIGAQIWMAENLRVSKYNDNTAIQNVTDNYTWKYLTSGAWCYNDNTINNNAIYGKLYNWYAVNTGKLCPKGWHIPNDEEWNELGNYLYTNFGSNVGIQMKSVGNSTDNTGLWTKYDESKEGTNESGFSGLPGGYRYDEGFYAIGNGGYWWSATEYGTGTNYAKYRSLLYNNSDLNGITSDSYSPKINGISCRCIKD